MTEQAIRAAVPDVLGRSRDLVDPLLRLAVETLPDPRLRRIAQYQMGWCDAEGRPAAAGSGKAIRPALALLAAEAVIGRPDDALPAAIAVELVHNFSLLHDDVMDRDVERRHRPTAWVVFGEGQAILAGTAMLTLAISVLYDAGLSGRRGLPCLLEAVQLLNKGQSQDLALEQTAAPTLEQVLDMEADKTAALLSCACAMGALAAGAPNRLVAALQGYGHELGVAFQLVDDILGISGDEAATGKSASSDIRTGKRSGPVVAALKSGTAAGRRLAELYAAGPPADDADVALAAALIDEAGGLRWAADEADARLTAALRHLEAAGLVASAVHELEAVARYIVERDR